MLSSYYEFAPESELNHIGHTSKVTTSPLETATVLRTFAPKLEGIVTPVDYFRLSFKSLASRAPASATRSLASNMA